MESKADGAARTVLAEGMPPPATVQAIISKAVCTQVKESRKRNQSLEDQLEHQRKKLKETERKLILLQKSKHDPKVTWGPAVGALSKKSHGSKTKQQLPPQLAVNLAGSSDEEDDSVTVVSPSKHHRKQGSQQKKSQSAQSQQSSRRKQTSTHTSARNPYNRGPPNRESGQGGHGGRDGQGGGRHHQQGRATKDEGQAQQPLQGAVPCTSSKS